MWWGEEIWGGGVGWEVPATAKGGGQGDWGKLPRLFVKLFRFYFRAAPKIDA